MNWTQGCYSSAFHIVILTVLIFCCVFFCDVYLDTLVITKHGWIRGYRAIDGEYIKYLGIPYAKVRDENPFGDSVPYPKFQGIFQATNDTVMCPQIDMLSLEYAGTIDCLHLDIFVPFKNKFKLPVMIFIHGGRFTLGFTGSFKNTFYLGPRYLVRHGVILIIVSYRLGPYGFFCLDSVHAPGNQGIKDIIKALSWIKDNIEAFGGDNEKMTVFGHSAGAMITDLLLYTKAEKYFNQAILQSGTSFAADVLRKVDDDVAISIAKRLGFSTSDVNESLNFLKAQKAQDVIKASKNLSLEWRPCIENKHRNYEGLIFNDAFKSEPNVKNKKIILGHTTEEYNMKFNSKPIQYFRDNDVFDSLLEYEFDFNNKEGKDAVSLVRQFYIGDSEIDKDVKWKIVNFTSDITFNYPSHRDMLKFLKNDAKAVYYYIFSYASPSNLYKLLLNVTVGRSIHGDELGYLFETSALPVLSDNDRIILDRITAMWTNFAKFGNPTPNTTELLPVKWIPINKENRSYLLIDLDEEMSDHLYKDRIQFWDNFYKTYKTYIRKEKTYVDLIL